MSGRKIVIQNESPLSCNVASCATMFAVIFPVAHIWNHKFVKVIHCIFNKLTKVVCIALSLTNFVS